MYYKGRLFGSLVLAVVLQSCASGYAIAPSSPNADFPAEISQRTFLLGVGAYRDQLEELVGHVVLVRGEGQECDVDGVRGTAISLERFLHENARLAVTGEPVVRYQSKIDRGFAASASAVALGLQVQADQHLEVVVTDVRAIVAPASSIDADAVSALASQSLPAGVCGRYLVTGVILSTVLYRAYSRIEQEGSVAGVGFAIGESVYSSTNDFSLDYRVGLSLRRVGGPLSADGGQEMVTFERGLPEPEDERVQLFPGDET
jgi:hypothetical protein